MDPNIQNRLLMQQYQQLNQNIGQPAQLPGGYGRQQPGQQDEAEQLQKMIH